MKIVDENGVELTVEPDLTLGRLVDDVEIVHHDAIAGVQCSATRFLRNSDRIIEKK